jgi:bisphosphoglycerate-dependent phosphoglycerate mutase
MIKEKIKVNNRSYDVTMNEQTHMYAMRLRRLYQQSYSDMDSFDEVSSEISSTVSNLLKNAVSPDVREEDMDGIIQQLLKMYEKTTKK